MIQYYNNTLECSDSFNDNNMQPASSCINRFNPSQLAYQARETDIDSLVLAAEYKGSDIPSLEEVILFFTEIFTKSQMESDCIVMALVYVERLIKRSHAWLRPTAQNWRPLLLICIMMASKVWDDISMINADFANICKAIRYPITLKKINELELSMLQRLKHRVIVSETEYTKYNVFVQSLMSRPEL